MAERKTLEELRTSRISTIPGWGVDIAKERRPGVPKKEKAPPVPNGSHWEKPSQQAVTCHIHVSVERPRITSTFGTTLPPAGLSGMIRNYAYTLGEDKKRRWLTLMAADRVDVIESAIGEFVNGRKYASPASKMVRRVVVLGGFAALVYGAVALRRQRAGTRVGAARRGRDVSRTQESQQPRGAAKSRKKEGGLVYQAGTELPIPNH